MNPVYLVITFLLLSCMGISQAQTDKYLITKALVDGENLSYPYITTKAYFEYSIDDQDVRYLKIIKEEGFGYSFGKLEFINESQQELDGRMRNVQDWTWQFSNSYDDVSGTAQVKISFDKDILYLDMTLENSDKIRIAGRYMKPSNPNCQEIEEFISGYQVLVEESITPKCLFNTSISFFRPDSINDNSYFVICHNRFHTTEIYHANIPSEDFQQIVDQLPIDDTGKTYIKKLRPYFSDIVCSY